ncbi:MAG: DNA polymerase III subunit delta [Bacteroidota bacterium]
MLFSEIIGQEEIRRRLIKTVVDGRVSHAQLFFGPEGIGKLPLAIAYAQYLSCSNKQPDDSCGECPSCMKYQKYAHPDLHFIFPTSTTKSVSKDPSSSKFMSEWREFLMINKGYGSLEEWYDFIGIENKQGNIYAADCGEIIRALSLKTYEAEFKVVVIWMVERLYYSAAPKLLKTLEEPPQKTIFLLVSENPDMIIRTILSRTQMVKIPRITDQALHQSIAENWNMSESETTSIVRMAEGNYIEACRLISHDEKNMRFLDSFREWMRLCYRLFQQSMDYVALINWIEDFSKLGREKQKSFIRYSTEILQECNAMNTSPDAQPKLDEQEIEFVGKFSKIVTPHNCGDVTKEMNSAYHHLERNANPKILMMDLSVKVGQLLN